MYSAADFLQNQAYSVWSMAENSKKVAWKSLKTAKKVVKNGCSITFSHTVYTEYAILCKRSAALYFFDGFDGTHGPGDRLVVVGTYMVVICRLW